MFLESIIDINVNPFEELSASANFEPVTKGRMGAVIVDPKDKLIPIVRTTTIYQNSATSFLPIHYAIIEKIKAKFNHLNLQFNNALVEIYDNNYRNMGYHSDQALDLDDDSYICLYSCYDNPTHIRSLKVQQKGVPDIADIKLNHNSIVLFSTFTNRQYLHKIVLESSQSTNKWLGITFRLSKTYIQFIDDKPYFSNNVPLTLASADERKQFYKCRGQENANTDYVYAEINYTISASDTKPIV